ncbi:histidine kinase dimerization/phosphoacceptor domain -containing protein [Paeniroseomonas aquatica]|uniref:histidine kinase n=1 Tax=Paeniroseomonas aquatica TaxID=373043 RepID=A0ABT8AE06_9PROT|nr:histidine kinase dimerization/phosphoacceptor domain -containing protein [Paeniroseomonas aquatica]MDN3567895.1 histidine kinase dimerization/phosphoacceptor domain -containing protein [Paeniroseomonas aquatica]
MTLVALVARLGAARRPAAQRWTIALACLAVAVAARLALEPALPPGFPFLTFFPAVILTAFLGGLWPAVAVAAGCGLAAWLLLLPSAAAGTPQAADLLALGFYAGIVTVDIAIIHGMTLALDQLRQERERSQSLAATSAMMFHELQHRVANNLQVVGALMTLQKATVQDAQARRVIEEAAARLGLIGRLHRKLHDPRGQLVDFGAFLRELCDDVLGSMDAAGAVRCTVDAEPLALNPDQSVPLALIVAELIANALEHGFPQAGTTAGTAAGGAAAPGTIAVALRREAAGRIGLTIADDGHGLAPDFDLARTRSLGLRIVKALAAQLGGSFEMESRRPAAGTLCRIRFAG